MTDEELTLVETELRRDHYLSDGNAYTLLAEVRRLRARKKRLVEAVQFVLNHCELPLFAATMLREAIAETEHK